MNHSKTGLFCPIFEWLNHLNAGHPYCPALGYLVFGIQMVTVSSFSLLFYLCFNVFLLLWRSRRWLVKSRCVRARARGATTALRALGTTAAEKKTNLELLEEVTKWWFGFPFFLSPWTIFCSFYFHSTSFDDSTQQYNEFRHRPR